MYNDMNVDNTGAIYFVNNYSTCPRTNDIDIRFRSILKVLFVKTEYNEDDITT